MGAPDAEGVYIYTEDDLAAPGAGFSEMLNKAPESISEQLALIRVDVGDIPTVDSINDLNDVDTAGMVAGDILQFDGTNLVPITPEFDLTTPAITVSDEFPIFALATTVASPTDDYYGNFFRWAMRSTITKIAVKLDAVVGQTYRFHVFRMNSARQVQTILHTEDIASPGAVTAAVIQTGTLAIDVDAGDYIAIGLSYLVGTTGSYYRLDTIPRPGVAAQIQVGLGHNGSVPIVGTTIAAATYPIAMRVNTHSR